MKQLVFFICLFFCAGMNAQKKQDLKVLYVGGTSNYDLIGVELKPDSITLEKSTQERMASFTKMLKRYFKTVKTIRGTEWTAELSRQYDVTVFDSRTTAMSPRQYTTDENGKVTGIIHAKYLPFDFDMPAVTIAERGEDLGRSLGLKTDWYCLCLDLEAHHWDKGHAVFKGPFAVAPETYMAPTPSGALEVAKIFGQKLPAETEMWRVVKKEWGEPRGQFTYRIGMVSRPDGFGDPDDEVISSGVSAKSIDAVAIGRHANFLHWGFAGSPDYLTKDAQNLLANCIVYISQFKGIKPIARKMNENIDTRHWLAAKPYLTSRTGYDEYVQTNEDFYRMQDSIRTAALDKQSRGEELSATEAFYITLPAEHPKSPAYHEYLAQREGELYPLFGDNTQLYLDYYKYNEPYLYTDGNYGLQVDQEAREWKIANNDIRLIEKAVELLEKGDAREQLMARTVLKRYTLCRYTEPSEWRQWLEKYRDKLFFSAGGGFLWLVNEQGAPGNDYSVLDAEKEAPRVAKDNKSKTTNADPVYVEGTCYNGTVYVDVTIHPGFHIYAQVAEQDPFIATKVKFDVPETAALDGDLIRPSTRLLDAGGTTVYEGECSFRQKIVGKGTVKVTVSYQCCDDNGCLLPTEKTVEVDLD